MASAEKTALVTQRRFYGSLSLVWLFAVLLMGHLWKFQLATDSDIKEMFLLAGGSFMMIWNLIRFIRAGERVY